MPTTITHQTNQSPQLALISERVNLQQTGANLRLTKLVDKKKHDGEKEKVRSREIVGEGNRKQGLHILKTRFRHNASGDMSRIGTRRKRTIDRHYELAGQEEPSLKRVKLHDLEDRNRNR